MVHSFYTFLVCTPSIFGAIIHFVKMRISVPIRREDFRMGEEPGKSPVVPEINSAGKGRAEISEIDPLKPADEYGKTAEHESYADIDEELDPEEVEILRETVRAINEGRMKMYSWEEVKAELFPDDDSDTVEYLNSPPFDRELK
jgi:hypothetical protein